MLSFFNKARGRKTPFNATRKAAPVQVAPNVANAANQRSMLKANAGVEHGKRGFKTGARMMSQQEVAQMQMDAARKSSRGMAKGGMVKANCGASVKPNGKAKK